MAFQDADSRETASSSVPGAVAGSSNQVHGQAGSQNGAPKSRSRSRSLSRDRERVQSAPLSRSSFKGSEDEEDGVVLLAVEWAPEMEVHAVERATRRTDCTLGDFRVWVDKQFRMTSRGERLEDVIVFISPNDGVDVTNNQEWTRALSAAAMADVENIPIRVSCTSTRTRPITDNEMRDALYFRDLSYETDLSVDSQGKERAYGLEHTRTKQETSLLISTVLGNTVYKMAVNKTKFSEATAADFNFEATNPFEDASNELFDKPMSEGYQAVQKWLASNPPSLRSLPSAQRMLGCLLGADSRIIHQLPTRLSADIGNPDQPRPGDTHKPHQVTGLYCSLYMEVWYGAFLNADGCGTGKLHGMISHILASTEYWERQELLDDDIDEDHNRPTLVVVPRSLLQKTYEELRDQLGLDWKVFKCNTKSSMQREPVLFDRAHPVYQSTEARRTVVVVALSQLKACAESEPDVLIRKGLFVRILVDEAQTIRRFDRT